MTGWRKLGAHEGRAAFDGTKMQQLVFQYEGVGRNANGPGSAQAV